MARDFINEIPELKQKHVHIKNPEIVNKKINGIVSEGLDHLQVVSDFDLTITKQHDDGKLQMSSFKMFSYCPSITQEYLDKTNEMLNKYRPLEFDPSIPVDEKRKIMEKWWSESEEALRNLKVSPKEIDDVIGKCSPALRDGCTDLFISLNKKQVPILVFSAGLGDTVVSVLKHFNVYLPNIKVISNFLKYDDKGVIQGFQGELIHVLNKNEYAIKDSDFYELVKNRNNVILMGDSLGDASMADGISHAHHVLKIGFIYEKVQGNLPSYMDTFDIVLEDDQTMDIPSAIVKAALSQTP